MTKISKRLLGAIRRYMIREYEDIYKGNGGFAAQADAWVLTHGTVWRMVTKPNHAPQKPRIIALLKAGAEERGIGAQPAQKRVRIDLDASVGQQDLKRIREMSREERTLALVKYINGRRNELCLGSDTRGHLSPRDHGDFQIKIRGV